MSSGTQGDQPDPTGRSTPTIHSRDTVYSEGSVDSGATNGPNVDNLRINIPKAGQVPDPGPAAVQPQRKKKDERGECIPDAFGTK